MLAGTAKHPAAIQRSDEDVLADVADRLWQDGATRAIERSALAVEVHGQEVFLLGHVTSVSYRQHVFELVRGVRGVQAIHNALVADPDLVTQVAEALAADSRTRLSVLGVGAFHGWINLSGEVPDLAARLAAEEVAARVAHVRGVLAVPRLPWENTGRGENRRPLQPHAAQAVYALGGAAGLVEEVVISPNSRLVSHIVVAGTLEINWRPIRGRWQVPVEAVERANESGVVLSELLGSLAARHAYNPTDLRWPPPDWQPPFPYRAGDVRCLLEPDPAPVAIPGAELFLAPWLAASNRVAI